MPAKHETVLRHYHYDALDRLVRYESAAQPCVERFYQKSRLVTEIEGQVQHSIFQHHDQLFAQQRRQNSVIGATLLAMDQQRSVLHAVEETRSHPVTYTPYGHHSAGELRSLLGFSGEQPDSLTGHYVLGNGYRAFNPVLMRFNSPDSWSPFGEGGLNAYGYCAGDPINRSDATGHAFLLKALMMFRESKMTPLGDFQRFAGAPHVMEKIAGNLSGSDFVNFSKASKFTNLAVQSVRQRRLGSLSKLQGDPLKKIAGHLPGDDLVSFSLASKGTKEVADSIQVPIRVEEGLPSRGSVGELRKIVSGKAPGIYPSQVLQNADALKVARIGDRVAQVRMEILQNRADFRVGRTTYKEAEAGRLSRHFPR